MLDNSYTVDKTNRLNNNNPHDAINFDGGKLFNLCLNLYTGFPLLDKPRNYIDSLADENAQVLLISNNKFIHPENYNAISIDTIIDMVKHSTTGIFFQHLEPNQFENRSGKTLCSALLGLNKNGINISTAILFDLSYGNSTAQKEFYYNLLSTLRELYTDLSKSRAVTNFLNNRTSYRYLVNSKTGELVAKRLPAGTGNNNDNLAESVFREIQHGDISDEQSPAINSQVKNLTMTRFKLSRFEYLLYSFEIPSDKINSNTEDNFADSKLFRCFVHRIKNKLGALQTASSQLALQEGSVIDKDDITLTEIIQSETEFIDNLITRTKELMELEDPEFKQFDIIDTVKNVLASNREKFSNNINVTIHADSNSCNIMGDTVLFKTAIDEIIKNGYEAGEDILIEINNSDKVTITIKNKLTKQMYDTLDNKMLDITEPYISLKQNKIGLGLSIVSKILSLHSGTIETSIETNREMIIKIILPVPRTISPTSFMEKS
ncbi:MAG: hypothetical protein GY865_01920 [candidate division Zixibacteria bacterium]|nr:hypothetical protein [candidate division Zixibacteria bacterium]